MEGDEPTHIDREPREELKSPQLGWGAHHNSRPIIID
jgi:hypothetical protein